uniref:Serpentine receptor class gamma n=1 Tax=Caenorhabditis japonica TaxID=281687 RepID=A0A8R1DVE2_CAEJA
MADAEAAEIILRESMSCDSGDSDLSQYLKFAIQLGYVLPAGFLYASFMATILRKRRNRELFHDSFFTLYLLDGAVTLTFLLIDILFMRVTAFIRPVCEFFTPLLKDYSYTLTPYFAFYMYLQFAKLLSMHFMNVNRYTSVNHPIIHKKIWVQHCSKAVALTLLIPLIFVWPVAISKTSFIPYKGQSLILYDHVVPWARTTYGRILVGGFTLVFTVFSSIVTSAKLSKLGNHMKRVEWSMNIATMFVSAGFVLFLALQVSYLVFSSDTMDTHPWIATTIFVAMQVSNDFYMLR